MTGLLMLRQAVVLVLFGSASLISAETSLSLPLRMSGNNGETRVAQMIESMRGQSGLLPLKRRPPSKEEVQLVCTAAATGKSFMNRCLAHCKSTSRMTCQNNRKG